MTLACSLMVALCHAGLLSDAESDNLQALVETKLKKLHYSPPRLPPASPAEQLAEHPLFADMPEDAFRRQVRAPNYFNYSTHQPTCSCVLLARLSCRAAGGAPLVRRHA